jgi:hypothetical protein
MLPSRACAGVLSRSGSWSICMLSLNGEQTLVPHAHRSEARGTEDDTALGRSGQAGS